MYSELVAIEEAISYVDSISAGKYVIITDSKSAIYHLARCTSNFRGSPLAYSILGSLSKLSNKNISMKIQWVPSHVGIPENEVADRLAREALTDGIPFSCLPLYSDHLYIVKEKCREMWKEHFDVRSLTKGIWYKTIQPSLSRLSWFDGASISRSDIVIALRLRSGHIPLNSFAFLLGKNNSPNCSECDVPEDVYHIIMECVRIEAERLAFLEEYNFDLHDVGKCNSILAFPLSGEAKSLYKLVKLALSRRG
ncbi:unnamed protein product [Euphydryas editha]|uniref:RNase H type-1 domain-containing protein n=1 Tax=Euphydryas editha TaxID=104508 RepID=A0AAU9UV40_EUPED|nr:unnamed protein product [Euphydryas editha]